MRLLSREGISSFHAWQRVEENFNLAKSVGILANDLLGQNVALVYIIPGVH